VEIGEEGGADTEYDLNWFWGDLSEGAEDKAFFVVTLKPGRYEFPYKYSEAGSYKPDGELERKDGKKMESFGLTMGGDGTAILPISTRPLLVEDPVFTLQDLSKEGELWVGNKIHFQSQIFGGLSTAEYTVKWTTSWGPEKEDTVSGFSLGVLGFDTTVPDEVGRFFVYLAVTNTTTDQEATKWRDWKAIEVPKFGLPEEIETEVVTDDLDREIKEAEWDPDQGEKEALWKYKSHVYREINSHVRERDFWKEPDNTPEQLQEWVEAIDSATVETTADRIILRGIGGRTGADIEQTILSGDYIGSTFGDKSFQSFTMKPVVAKRFAEDHQVAEIPVMIRTTLEKGEEYIPLQYLLSREQMGAGEGEMILPRNIGWKITNVSQGKLPGRTDLFWLVDVVRTDDWVPRGDDEEEE